MEKFKFYDVDKNYINYLKTYDSKVPNISYSNNDKFVCGVLFTINDLNYFAPISSFNKQQRSNILIKNSRNEVTSSIRFSFMFPVPDNLVKMKDFSKEDYKYKRLLMDELKFCNKNYDKIVSKAKYIYNTVINNSDENMRENCCNFKLLEFKCKEYINNQVIDNKKQLATFINSGRGR